MEQEIRFCTTSDGVRIAYATVGQGPPLVVCSGMYSHVEAEWEITWRRAWYERLAQSSTVVRYDRRGTGLSQRGPFDYSGDVLVADLEAVVDHLGLERLALAGIMVGGPAALLYTVRHPGKVSRLVLYGTATGGSDLGTNKFVSSLLSLARSNWAIATVLISNTSTGAVNKDVQRANEHYVRVSTDGETFARLMEFSYTLDVRPVLGRVTVPALVVHERDNRVIPIEFGMRLAQGLPNARFLPVDGDSSTPFHSQSSDATLETIVAFLGEGETCPDGLTRREVQVLRLVAKGRSNREIAAELVISTNTVDRHVSNILTKTGAANRAEAATYAARHGIVV